MKDSLYKYYLFYLKKRYDEESVLNLDETGLYAYTDEKEIAELFERFHDMSKFKRKEKWITKEEVSDLARYYFNARLNKKLISTKNTDTSSHKILIAITTDEDHMVNNDIAHSKFLIEYQLLNPCVFIDEIHMALSKLGYYEGFLSPDGDYMRKNMNEFIHMEPDYLYYYIRNFGDLITKKGL